MSACEVVLGMSSSAAMSSGPLEQEADEPPEPPEMRSGSEAAPHRAPSAAAASNTLLLAAAADLVASHLTAPLAAASAAAVVGGSLGFAAELEPHTATADSDSDGSMHGVLPCRVVSAASPLPSSTMMAPPSRDREERKEEVEERKVNEQGTLGLLPQARPEEKKSIVMLATAMLDDSHTPERRIAFNLGKMEMVSDLSTTLKACGHTCRYELVSHANMEEVLAGIKVYETVFNICDGTDVDGAVGVSLVHKLEQLRMPFAGACSQFYDVSSKKSLMKELFEKHHVATMPYRCVEADESAAVALASGPASLSGHLTHLKQWPLFVKPDDAYGSMGISDACVCRNQDELMAQCAALRDSGFQRLMVEGFLDGDEFSVLLTDAQTYPAVKKVYLREGALCLDFKADWIDNSYEMVTVKDDELDARLRKVALQAYRAVHGNSYARVDLRIHTGTGEICVLEVNSQPGIGDNSTAWDILVGHAHKAGLSKAFVAAEFLHQIVTHPRRGHGPMEMLVLPPPVVTPAPAVVVVRSSGRIVRSASNSSASSATSSGNTSDDESTSELSSSPLLFSPHTSAMSAPDSPASRVLLSSSCPSDARTVLLSSSPRPDNEVVFTPTPDPE